MKKSIAGIICGLAMMLFGGMLLPMGLPLLFILFEKPEPKLIFTVPGENILEIKDTGRYRLLDDGKVFDGRDSDSADKLPNDAIISIVDSNGRKIDFSSDNSSNSNTTCGESKIIGYFDIDNAGKYNFNVSGFEGERIFSLKKVKNDASGFIWFVGLLLFGVLLAMLGMGLLIWSIIALVKAFCRKLPETNMPRASTACEKTPEELPQVANPTTGSSEESTLIVLVHVLGLLTYFLGPLIIFLLAKTDIVREHARSSLNWQLSMMIYAFASFILVFVCIGYLMILGLAVMNITFCVMAAVKASQGELWQYPLSIRFLPKDDKSSSR